MPNARSKRRSSNTGRCKTSCAPAAARCGFLNDPVEDNASHTWSDYKYNWECTLTASLLQPEVYKFETMPWPERIFHGYYPVDTGPHAKHFGISREYQIELQAVIHALGQMKQPDRQPCTGTAAARPAWEFWCQIR